MNLTKIEHKHKRVLTTEKLAESYGVTAKQIRNNYYRNQGRFKEGIHFFCLTGQALKDFKDATPLSEVLQNVNSLYLWTLKGAFRHAKILNNDAAWYIYEHLEDSYFIQNELIKDDLSPQLQHLINLEVQQNKMKVDLDRNIKETQSVKGQIEIIKSAIIINPHQEWRESTNKIIAKICKKENNYKEVKDGIYKALDRRAKCNLRIRLNNIRKKALVRGEPSSDIKKLNYLDVIAKDDRLIEIYLSIVKEMAIKNGVDVAGY
ncbi:ORF6N domain-containing protein [Clostridium sp. DL1XJH146]